MQSDQTSQPELKDRRRFQLLQPQNQPNPGDDEGGLNLGQVVSALRRRIPIIIGVTTLVTSASVLKALTSTPIYQAGFDILTNPVTVEAEVISSVPQTLSSKDQQQQGAVTKGLDATKLQLLKSPKILAPIAKQLQLKYPDVTYDALAAGLRVTPVPTTEILNVSFQDPNPDKVKAILQLTSAAYIAYSLEERLADVKQGIDFVETQLPQLQKRVETIQDELQSFRQEYNLIDPDSASKRLSDQSNTVSQQLIDTQIRLSEARALYTDLSAQIAQDTDEESATSSALQDNRRYQAILDQLLEVESQIAKKTSRFRETAPNIQGLQSQRENLQPLLQREGERVQEQVASRIRELEDRNQILLQVDAQLKQQIKQLSFISRRYTDIQRELKIATDNLNQFLTKREALRIDAGQRKAPWQILNPPTEPSPSSANAKRSAMLGVILGVLLGTGVALLLDKLSNVIHSPEEAKDTSKLPILGVIPHNSELLELEKVNVGSHKPATVTDVLGLVQQMSQRFGLNGNGKPHYPGSPFLEAFRSLYANIRLLNSDTQIRSLVVSSCTPSEGKSTISVYLAQVAAALGQRVLLVDTDLRLPQLHNRLGLLNSYGLSNVISLDLDVEQVIQESPIESNLFVLTAGQVPPDPGKLLSSQKMQKLMDQFTELYDLVIYDTPPLLGLADTKLVAPKTDGIIMVVGLGKVKNSALTQTLEGLKQFNISVLGMVANGSKDYKATVYDSYQRYYSAPEEADIEPMVSPVSISEIKPLKQKQ
ncbi:MAG: polysaccharide biosynthesis tyrosine autokinase [Leptolyngbyaceae cyanobacterium bins.349]|nr:polysaccharide biosynthesis tyrosine autokinase [Leptolyngbyaceae cyanobacterium bins.349]